MASGTSGDFGRLKVASEQLGIAAFAFSLVIGGLTGYSSPALAQAYDLARAFRDAKARDPQLTIARANEAAAKARTDQASAALLPNLGATGTIARQQGKSENAPNPATKGTFTSQSYGLALTQPLFRLANTETLEQSKLAAGQSQLQTAAAEQELMVKVAGAYFDVLIANANLTAAGAQKRAISEQRNVASKSFRAGSATKIDEQEATARLDLSSAQEINAKQELDAKLTALRVVTGQPANDLARLAGNVELATPQPNNVGLWLEQSRKANLVVQQAMLGVDIAKREIKKQSAGHLPTVDLIGNLTHTRNIQLLQLGTNNTTSALGVQINAPIYSGGGVSAKVREATALQGKAEGELEGARMQAEQTTQQLFTRLASALALVKALETAERSSQLALDSNVLGYGVGVRVNVDVLNSQQQLFSTRKDLAKARYDFLLDGLRIKQAVGTLREEDLLEISKMLVSGAAD